MLNPNKITYLFAERLKAEGLQLKPDYSEFVDKHFEALQAVKADFCRKNKISLWDATTRDSIKRGIMSYLGLIKVGI